MNRWAVRILGILIVIAFALLMLNLQRQLLLIQRSHRAPATTTSTSR
jgi:hypothetical protein